MYGRKMKATEQISGNDNSYLYARQPSNPPRYRFCNKFGPIPFRTSWSLIERDGEETRGEPEPRGSKLHITAITPPCNPNLFVLLSKEEASLQTLFKNSENPTSFHRAQFPAKCGILCCTQDRATESSSTFHVKGI